MHLDVHADLDTDLDLHADIDSDLHLEMDTDFDHDLSSNMDTPFESSEFRQLVDCGKLFYSLLIDFSTVKIIMFHYLINRANNELLPKIHIMRKNSGNF